METSETGVIPLSQSTQMMVEKIIKIQGDTTGITPSKKDVIDSVIAHLYKNTKTQI